ncbi:HAD family hydrolase [Corynebacterium pacaense]|uniref:HAD family hydrolase n=1 Tax=Corynebacterium pacaense TaxID=1816684 RepID=UPI0009B94745|nr:HAD family hydrolase [Corynebacterium pacaense]
MDYRLVATDMDGTLLNARGEVPGEFWGVLDELRAAGVEFAPASGRQLATLRTQFKRAGQPISFIAENGTVVVHDGEIISLTRLDEQAVHRVIDAARESEVDMGVVICHPEHAYVERNDEAFRAEGSKYYVALSEVEDLHAVVSEQVVKVAVFTFDDAETAAAPVLRAAAPEEKVVVSGEHWVDIMDSGANKGHALQMLRSAMGIEKSEVLAFGDYLNDLELLREAGTSYAMANAHPDIIAAADRLAPSNVDDGVVVVLRDLLRDGN